MRKNQWFFRIVALAVFSVLVTAMVTLGVYSVVSPRVFASAKLEELLPRAQYLASQASVLISVGHPDETLQRRLGVDSRQWGASVWVLDQNMTVYASTEPRVGTSYFSFSLEAFEPMLREVFAGTAKTYIGKVQTTPNEPAVDLLFIGVPIEKDGETIGIVLMLQSMDEVVSGMSSLLSTLWFSAIAVIGVLLPITLWLTRVLTQPLRAMRSVALRTAAGDFSLRVRTNEGGEMGDLARAFNLLADELGRTISDLTRERNQAITIVNALGEGILSVDALAQPLSANPALQAMLQQGGVQPLTLPQEVWDAFRVALDEGISTERNIRLGELLLHLTVTPVGEARVGALSAIGVFHDETEAYRLEQTRREYVANVSHELRTPLTALRALIEPLRDGLIRTDQQRRDTYDIILRETMRLARLVDDMLELSRLQSGTLALEKLRFGVEPLLRDIASTYAAKAANTGHVLALEIVSPPLPTVLCNPDRTEQVLVALLNNAFTYTPPGSHITLRAEAMDDYLRVTIEDDGPGISEEALPHVFERFYKADKSHGGNTGTGLGLAIASELMHRLGETITVENRETGGARFMLTLHYE